MMLHTDYISFSAFWRIKYYFI